MTGPSALAELVGGDIHEAAVNEIRALHDAARTRLHNSYPTPGVPRAGITRHAASSDVSGALLADSPPAVGDTRPVERSRTPRAPLPAGNPDGYGWRYV